MKPNVKLWIERDDDLILKEDRDPRLRNERMSLKSIIVHRTHRTDTVYLNSKRPMNKVLSNRAHVY